MGKRFMAGVVGTAIVAALLPLNVLAQPPRADDADPAGAPVLLAAGSLRQAMTELLVAWHDAGGAAVEAHYGPSGLLRKEVEAGRAVDVFASASLAHTEALARLGLLDTPQVFAHNDLCVVSRPQAGLHGANLLEALARPALRLATSTPKNDPMGDYTWQFFRNADQRRPGLFALLDAKALQLSGGAALAPESTLPYITAFRQDQADAFIMYCTNAAQTKNALPELDVLRIPDGLNVRNSYAIAARKGSGAGAGLVRFVLAAQGQDILRKYGFH